MEQFGSALLNATGAFYTAPDAAALQARAADIRGRLEQVETALDDGPYFAGSAFGMIDAAFAPVFRYFDTFDRIGDFGFWADVPKAQRWRQALAVRPTVAAAVSPAYADRLRGFLRARLGTVAAHRRRDLGRAGSDTGRLTLPPRQSRA